MLHPSFRVLCTLSANQTTDVSSDIPTLDERDGESIQTRNECVWDASEAAAMCTFSRPLSGKESEGCDVYNYIDT